MRHLNDSRLLRKLGADSISFIRVVEFVLWFHMHEDVSDQGFLRSDRFADRMRDAVPLPHAEFGIHANMKVHVELETHLAEPTLIERQNSGYFHSDLADLLFEAFRRSGIHCFVECGAEELQAVPGNDAARGECSPVVSRGVSRPQSDEDAYKRKGAGDGVTPVMPRIRPQRGRTDLPTGVYHPAEKAFLHDHDAEKNVERPLRGHLMRRPNFTNALDGETECRRQYRKRDDNPGDNFRFAVSVRMLIIRRLGSDAQSEPHDEGAEDIEKGFYAIRNEGIGMADDPRKNLQDAKQRIDQHAHQRKSRSGHVCGLGSFHLRAHRRAPMEKVSAIVIHEHGEPSKVVRYESIELPPPGADEARVRVAFAPINPADLNVLEGKYPVRPTLPGVPGVEGVGVVEALGTDVKDLKVGMPVLLPHRFGTWRTVGNAPVAGLVHVPGEIPLEQAAMLRINPATALLMLREFVSLPRGGGGWVVQNAANSAVGRCVIRMSRHYGWRTVNVVRRAELIEELMNEGADVVLVEGETLKSDIAAATGGAPVSLALNAVGGDSATRMASALAPGGVIVTYGAMGRQPLRIPNGLLIFQDIAWRGFWVTRWYETATPAERTALFAELFELVRKGVIHTPIERTYPLAEITQAVSHAGQGKRGGKILLKPERP